MQPPAWSAPAFEPLAPGDPPLIGGYRVLARLGAGGMGRVYLAATQSGRRLAVKVVRPEFADDPEFRRRFEQEIVAAQRVQSLYTAPVIDAHPDGPQPWMATAHVPGPSLAQAVAQVGPLPDATVRALFTGMAEALQAIHAANVVHRDLKPSNVLLAADGPRVIDFGIARAADTTPLTRTGVRVGSPQFMAPEQALGRESTPAIDVFALGSVAFYAATGRTPFGDGPDTAVLFRIAHEEPDLEGCPEPLRGLVERCLAKEPADRPQPRAILAELEPDEGMPGPDWLPTDVTRRLPAYSADPPRPTPPPLPVPPAPHGSQPHALPPRGPADTNVPPGALGPGSHASTVPGRFPPGPPPGRRAIPNLPLILGVGGGALALLILVVLLAVVLGGGGGPQAAPSAAPVTTESAAGAAAPTPSVSGSGSGVPATGPGSVGSELGRYEKINLTSGYKLSFTDDPEHPKEGFGGDLTYDISLYGDQLSVLNPGQTGDYAACRDNTRYAENLGSEYIVKGKQICVTTESGLVGLVKILGTGDEPTEFITIDLTVWQGVPPTPGD